MRYLNEFHRRSEQSKMKEIEGWKKSPRDSKEAASRSFEMHRKLKELYPDKKMDEIK